MDEKDLIRKQIFETDDFFVGKKHEKKMYLLRKNEIVFNKIAYIIDHNESEKELLREHYAKLNQARYAKRMHYYKFTLLPKGYEYSQIKSDQKPESIKLKKGECFINNACEGYFKGNLESLKKFLDSLYRA